jgi:Exopolysaccharide biosynthesis protein
VPTHQNLGDSAQYMCIKRWIAENYPSYTLVQITTPATYSKKVRLELEKQIGSDDIIVFESGATFCNRHIDHKMHRYVLNTFKENKIVFFPQTVDLSDDGEMEKTAQLFNENPKALFMARDKVSFNMVKVAFDNNRIMLVPDIVTTLIGNTPDAGNRNKNILFCKRIDAEKKYTDASVSSLVKRLSEKYGKIDWTDTNFEDSYEYTMTHIEEVLEKKFSLLSQYRVILTDRYHGMIFSLIANTPVVVLETTGHKVKEGALWFKESYPNSIYLCTSLEEAENTIDNILSKDIKITNKSLYKEGYYDNLKSKIEEL